MMSAAQPECSTPEGVCSLEVRWIFPGQLSTAVAAWFEHFPAETESRDDAYLLAPHLRGLSVKLRGGKALDVKVYRGSPGILDITGRVRGCLESWQKWSFPYATVSHDSGNPAGWAAVSKTRRISRLSLVSGQTLARVPGPGDPACAVELAEVSTRGEAWWSLGLEATGPADSLRGQLEATAALVFTETLPGGIEPGPDDSRSYAEWRLSQWLTAEPDADG